MFGYAVRYGIPAGAITILAIILGLAFDISGSEAFGYVAMLLALSLVFVGIRQYRQNELDGMISWARGFGLGAMISLVAGLIYVVIWEIYLARTGYTFFDTYVAETLAALETSGATSDEIAKQRDHMESLRGVYASPTLRPLVTLTEILPVGLLVAAVSAGILRRTPT